MFLVQTCLLKTLRLSEYWISTVQEIFAFSEAAGSSTLECVECRHAYTVYECVCLLIRVQLGRKMFTPFESQADMKTSTVQSDPPVTEQC